MNLLYRLTILLSAALLFLAEPMAARQLLPLYGGSAAVWITSLVFFQAALLAGYAYAHALARVRGWSGLLLHAGLLVAAVVSGLLWAFGPIPTPSTNPIAGIFLSLLEWIGLPFLVLGATSPLLQVWQRRAAGGALPYSLYSWSNAASLAALLAYPTLVEPYFSLQTQRIAWSAGLAVFAALAMTIAWSMRNTAPLQAAKPTHSAKSPRLLWYLLAMAGSLQLSAVTAHLTTNVAAIPLLWVLPLAVYLATFIVAFSPRMQIPAGPLAGVAGVLLIAAGNFLAKPQFGLPTGLGIVFFLAELACACLFCHAQLYRLRPAAENDATAFYLTIAAGGATGAVLVGIVAPLVFRANYDLSLTLAVTAAAGLAVAWTTSGRPRLLWAGAVVILLALGVQLHQAYTQQTLFAERNFYGSLRVTQDPRLRTLLHGTVTHGTQLIAQPRVPTAYYAPDSGIGLALNHCCAGPRRIGVVGLGIGTLAAYAHPGDELRFYEINPAVEPIARDYFTYLAQAPSTVVTADGRAALAAETPQNYDVLVLDAFSGDAIPLHLLTVEAMAVYLRQLAPGGVLAFHISNQHVDLEPQLRELAAAGGLQAVGLTAEAHEETAAFKSNWVLMTRRADWLRSLGPATHPLAQQANVHPWHDDHASLLPLIRW